MFLIIKNNLIIIENNEISYLIFLLIS